MKFLEEPDTSINYKYNTLNNYESYKNFSDTYTYVSKITDGSYSSLYIVYNKKKKCYEVLKKISKYNDWKTEVHINDYFKLLSKDIKKNVNFINKIYDSFYYIYMISNWYPNGTLYDLIEEKGYIKEEDAIDIMSSMINCLHKCHEKNIVHLDVKCENFMFDNNWNLILIDFGHSEILDSSNLYGYCTYGTSYYLCPEGFDYVFSYKSDIWSLGVCFHMILTGELPFKYYKSYKKYKNDIMNEKYYFSDKLSDRSKKLIDTMLKVKPEERPDIYELVDLFNDTYK